MPRSQLAAARTADLHLLRGVSEARAGEWRGGARGGGAAAGLPGPETVHGRHVGIPGQSRAAGQASNPLQQSVALRQLTLV